MLRLTAPPDAVWFVPRVVILRSACRELCVVLVAASHDVDVSVLAPYWAHHFEVYLEQSRLLKLVQDSCEGKLRSIGVPSDDELHLANLLGQVKLGPGESILKPLGFRYIGTAL